MVGQRRAGCFVCRIAEIVINKSQWCISCDGCDLKKRMRYSREDRGSSAHDDKCRRALNSVESLQHVQHIVDAPISTSIIILGKDHYLPLFTLVDLFLSKYMLFGRLLPVCVYLERFLLMWSDVYVITGSIRLQLTTVEHHDAQQHRCYDLSRHRLRYPVISGPN
ncbi:hypothetical protein TNCV_2315371 [Trichonephila clavipes]|nr:hypothetical protein TNCV_2315371 [Trichonephila clavipes]